MLYPKENEVRGVQSLCGVWNFHLVQKNENEEDWKNTRLQDAEPIAVPASYNDQKDDFAYRNHCGWAVYQRTLPLPEGRHAHRVRACLLAGAACGAALCGSDTRGKGVAERYSAVQAQGRLSAL